MPIGGVITGMVCTNRASLFNLLINNKYFLDLASGAAAAKARRGRRSASCMMALIVTDKLDLAQNLYMHCVIYCFVINVIWVSNTFVLVYFD